MEREAFHAMCRENPSYKITIEDPLYINTSWLKLRKFVRYYNTRGGMLRIVGKTIVGECPAHVMTLIMRHVENNNFDVHETRHRAPGIQVQAVSLF